MKETEIKTIAQGRPSSSYFYVVQPPDVQVAIGETIRCVNPTTQKETTAICHDKMTYPWTQVSDSFCLLNYGKNALEIKTKIEEKYPELQNAPEVRFLFLKAKK